METGRLAEVNGLASGSRLKPGQTLLVQVRGRATDRIYESTESIANQLALADQRKANLMDSSSGSAPKGRTAAAKGGQSAKAVKGSQSRKLSTVAPARKSAASRDTKAASKKTLLARAGR
jgi:hypothetical protein